MSTVFERDGEAVAAAAPKPSQEISRPQPALGTLPRGEPVQVFAVPPGTPARPQIAKAEGIHLWDTEGRCFIDASSGPVACNLGYGNRRVLDAMHAQAETAAFANVSQFESAANRNFAELLCATAGPGYDRAFVVSGGSEAIEAALKLARQIAVARGQQSRWKVISRMPSYHGGTLGALSVTGDAAAHALFGPLMRDMPKVPAPTTMRLPDGHTVESWADACADALEASVLHEGPETVLAFLQEPVGGLATGALVPTDRYMTRVREICTRFGILLIHDEVMSGGGRTGRFLSHEHWSDCRADLVVMAKGLGAGYFPLGAVLASHRDVEAVASSGGFSHGHTAYGSPLACAVGHAVLRETLDRDLISNADHQGAYLKDQLLAMQDRCPIIGEVRGQGLLLAVELVADPATQQSWPAERNAATVLGRVALENGLIIYHRRTNAGRDGDWIMIAPPLTVTRDDLDDILSRLERAFEKAFQILS